MNNHPRNIGALLAVTATSLALHAQAPAPAADAASADEEIIELSPFRVETERDSGYRALSSMAGGRLNTPINDLPASVSVLTREFLDDISAVDVTGSAKWFNNANPQPDGPNPFNDYGVSVRGFRAGFAFRNFFISYINTDAFATERLDSARGPNALVFGDTKVGGAVNTTTKQAKDFPITQFTYRVNSFGGTGRTTFDINRKVDDKLAVRVAGLYQDDDEWQDDTGTLRRGLFGTVTFRPFENTTIRAEVEVFKQFRRTFGIRLTDNYSLWNGTTTFTGPATTLPAGSGTSRITNNTNTPYFAWNPAAPDLGVINWGGYAQTNGTGYQLDVDKVPLTNDRFPVLPDEEYTVRFGNSGVQQPYYNFSTFIEQRIGDNLFVELAYSKSFNERSITQFSTEATYVDINQNLPNGQPNPYFNQRFAVVDAVLFAEQSNALDEIRLSAAYLADFDWSSHRFLVGGSFRRDAYRDTPKYAVMPNAQGNYTYGNQFANNNRLRLRLYHDDRGIDFSLPPQARLGGFSFFPGEDKDLYSVQAAASSTWFAGDRVKTLVGVRRDKLSTHGVSANTDPVTGEFTTYNERINSRTFPFVDSLSGGVLVEAVDGVSPYVNYSEGFDTSSAGLMINPDTGVLDTPLPAKSSKGLEAGVKFDLFQGKITGAVAYYQNEQTNDSNTGVSFPRNEINRLWNVTDETPSSPRQIPSNPAEVIDYEGTGFEVDLVANLTREWRMIFNIAFPETEIKGGWARSIAYINNNVDEWDAKLAALTAAGDTRATAFRNDLNTVRSRVLSVGNGNPLTGTFDYSANLFTNYEFRDGPLQGFRFGGGVNVRGERYASLQQLVPGDPTAAVKMFSESYELYSAVAGYRTTLWGRKVDFQLNVDNLLDDQPRVDTGYAVVTDPATNSPTVIATSYYRPAARQILFTVKIDL